MELLWLFRFHVTKQSAKATCDCGPISPPALNCQDGHFKKYFITWFDGHDYGSFLCGDGGPQEMYERADLHWNGFSMRHDERVRLERAQWAEFEVPANERMDTWCLDNNMPLQSLKCTSQDEHSADACPWGWWKTTSHQKFSSAN